MEIEQKNALTIINGKGRSNFIIQGVLKKASQLQSASSYTHAHRCQPYQGICRL